MRRAPQVRVPMQMDGLLQARIDQVRGQLSAARQLAAQHITDDESLATPDQDTDVRRLDAELRQLADRAAATESVFVMQAVSYDKLEELKLACPPTVEQREQRLDWNPSTFVPLLLSECSVVVDDPVDPDRPDGDKVPVGCTLTVEQAQELKATWNPGQVEALFNAAWQVCHTRGVVRPFS